MTDFVIPGRLQAAAFQAIERRLPGHRRAILAPRREFTCQHCHNGIVAQCIMIIEILIPKRNSEHPLSDQGHHLVFD
jgi:hypothetical protein